MAYKRTPSYLARGHNLFQGAIHLAMLLSRMSTLSLDRCCQLGCLFPDFRHATNHVEGILREVVTSSRQNLLKVTDGGLQVNELTWGAREDLCNKEWLGEESLDLACSCHSELVLLT